MKWKTNPLRPISPDVYKHNLQIAHDIESGQDSLILIKPNLQCLIYYSNLFLPTLLFVGMSNTNLIIWKKVVQLEGRPNSLPDTRRRLALADRILFWEFSSELLRKQIIKYIQKWNILSHCLAIQKMHKLCSSSLICEDAQIEKIHQIITILYYTVNFNNILFYTKLLMAVTLFYNTLCYLRNRILTNHSQVYHKTQYSVKMNYILYTLHYLLDIVFFKW